eukprot:GHVR01162819.1.p2 GENE.GHVR01162819.1~~GHVR01162819.1.p2  ORF type:complete len:143 (+),score=12.83 GHVR01162819.1:1048-1476(+)
MIGRFAGFLNCFLLSQERAFTLIGFTMNLHIFKGAVFVDKLEGVARVAVDSTVSVGDTSVAEQDHDLMNGFRVLREVVPKHVRVVTVRKMRLRVSLLSVNEMRKLDGIANEEDRRVVENPIPNTLFGLDLDREPARVSSGVR